LVWPHDQRIKTGVRDSSRTSTSHWDFFVNQS
jgi:hypothetical protein